MEKLVDNTDVPMEYRPTMKVVLKTRLQFTYICASTAVKKTLTCTPLLLTTVSIYGVLQQNFCAATLKAKKKEKRW